VRCRSLAGRKHGECARVYSISRQLLSDQVRLWLPGADCTCPGAGPSLCHVHCSALRERTVNNVDSARAYSQ
jgi:hypothetical protein